MMSDAEREARNTRPHGEGLFLRKLNPDTGHEQYRRVCQCGWCTPRRNTRYEVDELLAEHLFKMTLWQIERRAAHAVAQ